MITDRTVLHSVLLPLRIKACLRTKMNSQQRYRAQRPAVQTHGRRQLFGIRETESSGRFLFDKNSKAGSIVSNLTSLTIKLPSNCVQVNAFFLFQETSKALRILSREKRRYQSQSSCLWKRNWSVGEKTLPWRDCLWYCRRTMQFPGKESEVTIYLKYMVVNWPRKTLGVITP